MDQAIDAKGDDKPVREVVVVAFLVHGERPEPAEERRQQLASIFGSAPADDTPTFLLRVDDLDIPWPPGMTAKEAVLSWAAEWATTHLSITYPGPRSEAYVADLRAQGWKEEMWSPSIAVFTRVPDEP